MTHPYDSLTPDTILDAVEAAGFPVSGSLLALNSYENRVYQVGLDSGFVVAKFYRPERWSDAAILEEHAFACELAGAEIPVVAPLPGPEGRTLMHHAGFRFAVFPRRGGRSPELDDPEVQLRIGRFLGRIHAVGAARPFTDRPTIAPADGRESADFLLENRWLPPEHATEYRRLAGELLALIEEAFGRLPDMARLRLHGDCHPGNILWTDAGAHFVDLDDCRAGPAVQDLWMLIPGDERSPYEQLADLVAGYEEFHDFDWREVRLIEPLRTLRIVNYAAWLARRWDDPAFPMAFPWFATPRYWDEHILTLREQLQRLSTPPELP